MPYRLSGQAQGVKRICTAYRKSRRTARRRLAFRRAFRRAFFARQPGAALTRRAMMCNRIDPEQADPHLVNVWYAAAGDRGEETPLHKIIRQALRRAS